MRTKRNPNYGQFKIQDGYTDIGWQLTIEKSPELKKCIDAKHTVREYDNSMFEYRCTDIIRICDICKIISHTDMSD